MSQRHMLQRQKNLCIYTEATCTRDVSKSHAICHLHTHENVAGTYLRDMLQRHVPSRALTLLRPAHTRGHVSGIC